MKTQPFLICAWCGHSGELERGAVTTRERPFSEHAWFTPKGWSWLGSPDSIPVCGDACRIRAGALRAFLATVGPLGDTPSFEAARGAIVGWFRTRTEPSALTDLPPSPECAPSQLSPAEACT